MMTLPVLIIGAGPVGMTMASELARYGIKVRIIDKAAQRTDKSKALVLWSRTLELLDRGGGSAPFLNAGFKVDAVNFIARDKTVGHVSMKDVQSLYSYALMLPQSETERLLEERLYTLGVTVDRQVELTAFTPRPDGVDATLTHADGHQESVSTEWLLGCDGAHSAVRHGLNAEFTGETMNSDWILADIHMTGYPYPDTEASIYWHRDGAFVIFPISPGRYRILADLPMTPNKLPPTPTLPQVQAIIDRRGPSDTKAFDPIWLAGFRINGRKVSAYRQGRVFLAGDAAHVHSPAGGQGMNTGMQDAFNLSWKLAAVIHGICGEHVLDSYSLERSAVGDEVLKNAGRLTEIGTMKNPAAQAIRNFVGHLMLGLSPVQHAFTNTMSEVTIGYPNSPLNGPAHNNHLPKPGARVVPVPGQPPFGSGPTPQLSLLAEQSAPVADLLKRFNRLLDSNVRPPLREKGICLVRPDGYVAMSTTQDRPQDVATYLDRLITQ
ncbi:MAG TPA: FAD-dependent monooxygenase [Tepidisphaeraceae bacterium]|jgi:2-polyprenyl-6-methoxyphenol hydroxylase-like FAD-dependent oxidoreductase